MTAAGGRARKGEPIVRPATLADVAGIADVHADCDDPWRDPAEAAVWVNQRLLKGFLIDVAVLGGRIVGHAEWIVSDEPEPFGRHLYLSMMQVHRDFERRGIGRAMVEAGVARANHLGCPRIRTVPEREARGFYRACGFAKCDVARGRSVRAKPARRRPNWAVCRSVPRRVIKALPMRLGWLQAGSAHNWSLANRPVRAAGDLGCHPCVCRADGRAYVQLRYWEGDPMDALVLAWAAPSVGMADLCEAAQALAAGRPIERLLLVARSAEALAAASAGAARRAGTYEIWSRSLD